MENFEKKSKRCNYEFLEFIDSPDIREFNKNTIFSPAEQAVLIVKSRKKSIKSKIGALQYLVDHYSENEFQADSTKIGDYCEKTDGKFRNCVIKTIEKWKEILQDRYRNKGYVYAVYLNEKDFIRNGISESGFFSSYEKAYEYLVKLKKEYLDDEDLKSVDTFGKIYRLKLDDLFGTHTKYDEYLFNNEMLLCDVWMYPPEEDATELDEYNIFVPLPFEIGDIVKVKSLFWEDYYGVISHKKNRNSGLWSMMTSIDVYDEKSGKFDWTDDTDILGLEFCSEEELPEGQKILKALSKARRGELDFFNLLYFYGKGELERLL